VRSRVIRSHDWLGEEKAAGLTDAQLMKEIEADRVIAACEEVLAGGGTVLPAENRLPVAV
jgi:hypothetical protein